VEFEDFERVRGDWIGLEIGNFITEMGNGDLEDITTSLTQSSSRPYNIPQAEKGGAGIEKV